MAHQNKGGVGPGRRSARTFELATRLPLPSLPQSHFLWRFVVSTTVVVWPAGSSYRVANPASSPVQPGIQPGACGISPKATTGCLFPTSQVRSTGPWVAATLSCCHQALRRRGLSNVRPLKACQRSLCVCMIPLRCADDGVSIEQGWGDNALLPGSHRRSDGIRGIRGIGCRGSVCHRAFRLFFRFYSHILASPDETSLGRPD